MKIGLMVGSLRKDSWNRKVAEAVQGLFPEGVEADFIEIKDLPLYNQDTGEGENAHDSYKELWKTVREYDGFIFFTPEYNRSYAPVLKNAIDVVSRDPEGISWAKKPAAVFSASPGGFGGVLANHALRQVLVYNDLIPMQQPEVYLSKVHTLFENGELNAVTTTFLNKAVDRLVEMVEILK